MDLVSSMEISASALSAQRTRLNIISQNLANANTTKMNGKGGPYRRQITVFSAQPFRSHLEAAVGGPEYAAGKDPRHGVEVEGIFPDDSDFRQVYDPGHPDADDKGYVLYPNVNVVTEMVNMVNATRSYEANVTAVNAAKRMALKSLDILR
jgi:flagellar basal-body rod protein FlgC